MARLVLSLDGQVMAEKAKIDAVCFLGRFVPVRNDNPRNGAVRQAFYPLAREQGAS